MAITKSIGKNTLGSGNKMTVDLRTYNRSTHNLSYAWRSTMGVGTLVPCMKIPAFPGDTFEINIDKKVMTHPTVGPLFGSYKMQVDIFTCPMRLYMSGLHNNMLNVGLNMAQIKVPKINRATENIDNPTKENPWAQVHPSCILSYLGFKGQLSTNPYKVNAIPLLAYLDIFKNYYANKQEENFYSIMPGVTNLSILGTPTQKITQMGIRYQITDIDLTISPATGSDAIGTAENIYINVNVYNIQDGIERLQETKWITVKEYANWAGITPTINNSQLKVSKGQMKDVYVDNKYTINTWIKPTGTNPTVNIKAYELEELDKLREQILAAPPTQEFMLAPSINRQIHYLKDLLNRVTDSTTGEFRTATAGCGLLLKTLQSDIFNNWINTEWIDGDNGISAITAIDTSSGEFTIDTLNLAKKVYDMLNRIAVSGGSYRDWIETVYTGGYMMHTETPVYEGGMSCEIEFQEVVSNSATEDEPLGTLAGRGVSTQSKGGTLHIKINEPCYIIGIVSITPRVDYCQGNDWDMFQIDTMDDWHKPALDGIGFQDLLTHTMAWWQPRNTSVGKQPAWINYMTNFNKTFGNFAIEGNEAFMVLNRYYDPENDNYTTGTIDYSTYIDPSKYNYIFADTNIEAQNFWVQLGFGIKARRVMSAKQIPNL